MDTKKGKNKGKKGATSTPTPQPSQDKKAADTTKESTPPKPIEKLEHNTSLPPATKEERYKKAFAMIDKDNSGEITKAEFKTFFDEHGFGKTWTHEQLDDMFDEIDTDRGGTIDVTNFLNAFAKEHPNRDLVTIVNELLHEKKVPEEHEGETEEERRERIGQIKQATRLKREEEYKRMGSEKYSHDVLGIEQLPYKKYQKAFTLLDLNDNGHISEEELVFVLDQFHLGENLKKQEVDDMFNEVDNDKDGHVSFMDFLESLNTEHPNKALLGIIAAVHTKSKEIKSFKFEHKQQIATQGLSSLRSPQKSKPAKPTPAKAKQDFDLSEIHLSDTDFNKYNKVFDSMDFDSNGCVSKDEFEKVVKLYLIDKVSDDEINTNFTTIDQDNSGAITLYEFLKAIEDDKCPLLVNLANMIASDDETSQKHIQLDQMKKLKVLFDSANPIPYARDVLRMPEFQRTKYQKAFSLIDMDNSGRITKQEFEVVLKQFNLIKTPTREAMDELYNSIDIDNSGGISLLEFWTALGGDKPNKKLAGMVDTIIRKEKEILAYIKKQGIKRGPTPDMNTPVKSKTMGEEKKGNNEIDELKRIISQKDTEISDLNGLLKLRDIENAELLSSKEELDKKIADFEKQIKSLQEENEKYVNERPEIEEVKKMIENIVGHVMTSPDSHKEENENQSPKGYLEKIQSEFDRRISMIKDLKVENLELIQKANLLDQEKKILLDTESDQKKRIEDLEKLKEDLNVEVTKVKNELDNLQSDYSASQKEVERLNAQLKDMVPKEDLEKASKEHGDVQHDIEDLRASELALKNEKAKLEADNSHMKERVETLQKYKEDTSEEVTKLTSQLADTKANLERSNVDIEQLKEQIKTMVSHEENDRIKQEKSGLESQLDTLRTDLEHIKNEKDTLTTEKHQLDEKLKDYDNQRTEAISQRDELAHELEELKGKHNHAQEDIKGLNERLEKMVGHEEFEQVKKERDDKTHELDTLKAELDHVKQAKNLLEISQQQHNEREGGLEQEKQDINVHLSEAKNELENLKATNNEHVQEIERLKTAISTMTSHEDTEKLKKEKEEVATENEKLKKDLESVKTEEKSLETEQGLSHKRIEELEKEKEDLKVQVSNLENDLESVKVESNNAEEEVKRLNEKLATMVSKEDYDKLSKEHGDTQGDTENLRASETALKNEKERLEAENGHLQKRVDDLEKFNKENDAELAKLKSELDNHKSDLELSHKQIEDIKKEMSTMTSQEDTDKLKHEKDNLAHEVENLKKEVQNVKTEEESVDVERNNFKARAEDLEKQKDELNVNLTKLQSDFDDIKAKHTDAEEEIQKLKDTISTMTSQEEVDKIIKERDDLVKANDSLREDIDKNKTEKGSVEEEQHHLEEKVKKLEEENHKVALENNTLIREVEDLTTKKTENEEEIKTLKEKIENMTGEEEVNKIKKERDDKAKENDDLKTEIEHIKTEKGTLEHEQSLLKQEVEDLKKQKEELNIQINDYKNEVEKVQAENENYKKDIQQLNDKLSTMVPKDQVDELKKEQAELKHESDDLHNLEVSLENEKKRLEGENAELNKRIEEVEKKKDEANEQIAKLTSQLEASNSKVEQNQHEIERLNAQIGTMMSQEAAEKLKEERDDLDKEAAGLVEKIAALNAEREKQVQEIAKQKDEIAADRDRLTQELEALKVKDNQDLAEIQNLKEKESHMVNKEEYDKIVQERDEIVREKDRLNERLEALQEQDYKNLAEIQSLRDNAISQEEFERIKQENEELNQEVKSLKAQIDDDKIVSFNSLAENYMAQQVNPPQEVPRDDGLSIEEIQTIRGEILGKVSDEEVFLRKMLQSISGETYKNPMKEGGEEGLPSQAHSRRLSLVIKDPGFGGNMIDYESAQKLSKMLSKPEEPESAGQGFGPSHVPTLAELQQKYNEIKQLRQDIVKRLEVEKAAKEYIKEQKKEKEQENYQLKEQLSKYQSDTKRNIEHIIHDEGVESPKGGIKQEGQNETSPPYTKDEFRELIKDRDFLLKQLHQVTEALNKKQLKTSLQGEDYQVSSEIREILDAIEKSLETIINDNVRAKAQASEQPQDMDIMQIIDYNVEEINKLVQKLQKAKAMSPTSPKKKTPSLPPSSIKKKNLISQSPIKPVYEVKVPSEKSEHEEEEAAEKKPEVVENFVLDHEAIKFLIKHLEGYLQQLEQNKEPAEGGEENKETAGVDISKDDQVKGFISHIKQAGLQDFMSLVKDLRDLTVQNANLKKQLANLQKPEEDIEISQSSPVAKRLQNMNEFGSNASQNQVELEESFNNNMEQEGSVVISEAEQTYPSELEITTPKVHKAATAQKSNRPSELKRQFTEKEKGEEEESWKDKLENLTKANEKLCQELLEKGMEIEKLTEDFEALKGNQEAASRNNEELNKVQEVVEALKKANENLTEENTRKSSEVEKLTQDLQKALEQASNNNEEEYKKLQVAFESLKKECEALAEEGSRKNAEFDRVEKERHQLSKISKIYEEENNKLKKTYDEVLAKLKELDAECSRLMGESQATKKENANLQKTNEALLRKLQEASENPNEVAVTRDQNTEKKAFAPKILVEGSEQKRFLSPSRDMSRNTYSEIQNIPYSPSLNDKSRSSPNLSYHILHWLSDGIVFLKKLAAVCQREFREEIKKDLKKIAMEVCELNNGVKEYYTKNQRRGEEDPLAFFNHIQDLLKQCYQTQKRLQPIEDKVLTHIEELRGFKKK